MNPDVRGACGWINALPLCCPEKVVVLQSCPGSLLTVK
jgi:hypothetical protein